MKRLLTATVIFLSSCTAYADYASVKTCAAVGNYVSEVREEVASKNTTIESQVNIIKNGNASDISKDIILSAFSESGRSIYTNKHDWYVASAEVCLKITNLIQLYGADNHKVKDAVTNYLLPKDGKHLTK